MEASAKQIAYIDSLKDARISKLTQFCGRKAAPEVVLDAAIAYVMPAPADSADASAQIDALKGNLISYARQKDWALALQGKLAGVIGMSGESCPMGDVAPFTGVYTLDGRPVDEWLAWVTA